MRLKVSGRMAFWIGFGIILVASILLGGIGDRSIRVNYANDTTEELTVYPYGRDYPAERRVVSAGGTVSDNLLAGDARDTTFIARIEAYDSAGSRVFCHGYTYGELVRLGNVVHLAAGKLDC